MENVIPEEESLQESDSPNEELLNLKETVSLLNNQVEKSELKIQELLDENKDNKSRNIELEKIISQLRKEKNDYENELSRQKQAIVDEKAHIEKLKKDLNQKDNEIDRINHENSKQNDTIEEFESIKNENKLLKQQISSNTKDIEDLDSCIKTLEIKGKSLEKEKEQLLSSIDQLQEENDQFTEKEKVLIDSHKETENMLNSQISVLNNQIIQYESKIQELEDELNENEDKINNMRSQLSSNKINDKDKINTIVEEHNQNVDKLVNELAAKDQEIAHLLKKIEDFSRVSEERIAKSEKLADQKSIKLQEDFLKEYELIVKEKEVETNKFKDLKIKFDKCSADFTSLVQQKSEMDQKNEELTQTISSLTQKLQESDKQCNSCVALRLEKIECSRKVDELNEKMLKLESHSKEIEESYISQINQLRENFKESTQSKLKDEQLAKFRVMTENMQKRNNSMNEEIKKKMTTILTLEQENDSLKQRNKEYIELLNSSSKADEISELEESNEKLVQQITEVQETANKELAETKTKLNKEIDQLKIAIERERKDFKEQILLIQKSASKNDEVDRIIKLLEEEKKKSQNEAKKSENYNKMIEQMSIQSDQYLKDIDKLKVQLEASKNKEKGLEKTIQILNTQLSMMPP